MITLAGHLLEASCNVYLWPGRRSYTRQPSAELHTLGSMPVVEALVDAACRAGARLAAPGEFTLRALLAGRIDLVQAEAVLGVIDAPGDAALRAALGQLAGGLSAPIGGVRDELINLLAELEAGLDFVDEEDIRFIEPGELAERLADARAEVGAIAAQATTRGRRGAVPRVAIVGPPNAGKSSLLNALGERWGTDNGGRAAIVSPEPGATRDSVAVELEAGGVRFVLVDTAGRDEAFARSALESAAEDRSARDARDADLRVVCRPVDGPLQSIPAADGDLLIATKCDLAGQRRQQGEETRTSSHTGEGLEELKSRIVAALDSGIENAGAGLVAETAERCRQLLADAASSLDRAAAVAAGDHHELVALELRSALDHLGQVTGAVVTDDLLDRIFSKFCIGK